jgi:hypothetical protein
MSYEDTFRKIKVKDSVVTNNLTATTLTIGTQVAPIVSGYVDYTATATNTVNSGCITLTHNTVAILIAVPAPGAAGKTLIIRDNSASGTAAHVVTATGGKFDGTNNTATFNAPGEQLILYSVSATDWIIVLNSGSVGMSSV